MEKFVVAKPGDELRLRVEYGGLESIRHYREVKADIWGVAHEAMQACGVYGHDLTKEQYAAVHAAMYTSPVWRKAAWHVIHAATGYKLSEREAWLLPTDIYYPLFLEWMAQLPLRDLLKVSNREVVVRFEPLHSYAALMRRAVPALSNDYRAAIVNFVVLTKDNEITFAARGETATWKGLQTVIASGCLSFGARPEAELEEELGLSAQDLSEPIKLIGIHGYQRNEAVFVYLARTTLSRAEMVSRWWHAKDRFEHTEPFFVPVERLGQFGRVNDQRIGGKLVDLAIAALEIFAEYYGIRLGVKTVF